MGCQSSNLQNEAKYIDKHKTQRKKTLIGSNQPFDLNVENKQNMFEGDIKLNNNLTFAQELIKNELYKEALKQYESIKESYPQSWPVYNRMGECYRLMNNYDDALKCHLYAFSISNHPIVCNSLSICYRLKQDYANSEKYAKMGIQINPDQPSNYTSLGTLYLLKKQRQNAEQYFLQSMRIAPKYAQAYLKLAQLYSSSKYHQMALQTLQKYHKDIDEDNIQIMYQIGVIYKDNLEKLDKSLQFFKKCLAINNNHAQSYNQIGYIYFAKKNWKLAEENFNTSIKLSPKSPFSYNGLGNNFKAKKQYIFAIENYLKAIEIDPTYSTAFCGLGNTYKQKGEFTKAIQMYKKSIQLNPSDINPYNGLGNLYKSKGNREQAITYFKQSIKIKPKNVFAYYGLGIVYKELKDFDEAVKYFIQAIKINPKDSIPYSGIGSIRQQLKQYQEAEKWYRKCIDVDPKNEKILILLGNLYKKLNRNCQAEEMYLKAYEVNPKNHSCCNSLAVYYSQEQQSHKAVYFYKKAIQNNPMFPLAYINLSMTLIDIQNYQQAFKYLKQAKRIIDTSERDVCGGRKGLITQTLSNFQKQMQSWQFKIKQGYMSAEDKQKIAKMKQNFEKKFEKMFSLNDGGQKILNQDSINKPFVNLLQIIKQDNFSLAKIQQITKINFQIFEKNNDYFSIMAFLFCKNFWVQKKTKNNSIKQIEEQIDHKLFALSNLYKPSKGTTQTDGQVSLKAEFKQKKPVNLFNKLPEYVEYFKDYTYLIIAIENINKICAQVLPKFKSFIQKICHEQGDCHVKANLKLSDKEAEKFKVYIRVMEKMFKEISHRKWNIIESVQKKLNASKQSNMQTVMSYLIEVWTQQITLILKERIQTKTPTYCYISDFVRGKAVFKSIDEIERAANRIIDQCGPRGYQIVQIDNRLTNQTKDLVFKICIDGIVCEFQMAMDFDATQYNFSHSLYEIKRSPLGCIFGSFLFLSKFDGLSFAKQTQQLSVYYNKTLKKLNDSQKISQQAVDFLLEALKSNL